ncbi:MAG: metalloregulator ArsR/SmtB family transcription factor [Deferribacteres bacterium]|nr:ArsR family transcriptional regulator [candidate division KSB1 bacterium]MCB9503207.1 metalloregulator ArsR/SmtB family transcription factor [Deferribacteres bacterium]
MKGREFKDAVFEQFARIATAFAAPKRLEIIDILAQGERDVDSLAREGAMTVANASRHLQIMKAARIVNSRREGVRMFYSLSDDDVVACWVHLQSLAEKRVAEVREISRMFLQERQSMDFISAQELWERIQAENVVVLDVRPTVEFEQSHIPRALSVPLAQLQEKLPELPKNIEIVAYCRGPYCVLSPEAVKQLKKAGIRAIRLQEGLPEWKQMGLPIEY